MEVFQQDKAKFKNERLKQLCTFKDELDLDLNQHDSIEEIKVQDDSIYQSGDEIEEEEEENESDADEREESGKRSKSGKKGSKKPIKSKKSSSKKQIQIKKKMASTKNSGS